MGTKLKLNRKSRIHEIARDIPVIYTPREVMEILEEKVSRGELTEDEAEEVFMVWSQLRESSKCGI